MPPTRVTDVAREVLGSIYICLPWRLQRLVPLIRIGRGRWRVAPVADLPYPHDLFKCSWREVHRSAIAAETGAPDGRQHAFEAFLEAIGNDGIAQCPYHEIDWAIAADFICEQFDAKVYDLERIATAAQAADLDDKAIEGIFAFFSEPVWINGTGLGNGQHRSCAIRAAGGTRCPVER